MSSNSVSLSLDGIRVVDLSRVIAGPFCGALLGDMGADVIKVEDTQGGDEARAWFPQKEGQAAAYIVNNRNKRGIAVDLKDPEGVEIVSKLAVQSDVLIENFRTGTMEKFGLSYESLAAINPRLIYCSISAFGRSGPRAEEAGYEALMQAFGGIMSITGEAGGQPVRCGASFLDLSTGTLCAFGIVNAILQRTRTGLGQRIDGTLLHTAIAYLNLQAQGYLLAGIVPRAAGSGHPSFAPYRNFRCRDGQWVLIAGINERLWRRIAQALGLNSMIDDPRFATNTDRVRNRAAVDAEVEKAVGRFDTEPLLKLLMESGVPAAPVNTLDQTLNDPQTASLSIIQRMSHTKLGDIPVIGMPLEFSRLEPGIHRSAPLLGEHTNQVLAELGYSAEEISRLREKKAIL